jgi:hypothetical protein
MSGVGPLLRGLPRIVPGVAFGLHLAGGLRITLGVASLIQMDQPFERLQQFCLALILRNIRVLRLEVFQAALQESCS